MRGEQQLELGPRAVAMERVWECVRQFRERHGGWPESARIYWAYLFQLGEWRYVERFSSRLYLMPAPEGFVLSDSKGTRISFFDDVMADRVPKASLSRTEAEARDWCFGDLARECDPRLHDSGT